jgi:hypothetical protein
MLEWQTSDGIIETLSSSRLMSIIKYTRKNNLKNYIIKGFKAGKWEVIIKLLKPL